MTMGLMAVAFDFRDVAEDEFHDWYDTEHLPERERVEGFLNLQRWIGAEDPRVSVATYDLRTPEVLESAAYRAISGNNLSPWSKRVTAKCRRLLRFQGEQMSPHGDRIAPADAGALLLVGMNVSPDAETEFNRWYDEEHLPALAALPGVLCARRFRAILSPLKYLALYHMSSSEVCASAAWKKAVDTPWTQSLRPQVRDRLRIVCNAYKRERQAP
jgi:hypothetical protein